MAKRRSAQYVGTNLDIVENETPGTKNEKPFELVGNISKLDSNGEAKPITSRVLLTRADVEAWSEAMFAAAGDEEVTDEFASKYLNENGFSIVAVDTRVSALSSIIAARRS